MAGEKPTDSKGNTRKATAVTAWDENHPAIPIKLTDEAARRIAEAEKKFQIPDASNEESQVLATFFQPLLSFLIVFYSCTVLASAHTGCGASTGSHV
jgi:hypothetical protein